MKTITTIPSNKFRPETMTTPFTLSAPNLAGNFSLPRWSTHALHPQKEGISLFKTQLFNVNGSYHFFSEAGINHIERLKLDIQVSNIKCLFDRSMTRSFQLNQRFSYLWLGYSLFPGSERELLRFFHTIPNFIRVPRQKGE